MLCRDPEGGYARYLCPGCQYEHRVPFSCKTRFCPSCGKIHVDNWVNDIAKNMLEVPHLHITLTTDNLLRPFFYADRLLLKLLLQFAAQAVREILEDLYPDVHIKLGLSLPGLPQPQRGPVDFEQRQTTWPDSPGADEGLPDRARPQPS